MSTWSRLIRFLPKSNPSQVLIGQPIKSSQDVGLSSFHGETIEVEVFSGTSVCSPGSKTGQKESVHELLSPLAEHEVGTIRCIGLNVSHLHYILLPGSHAG